MTLEQDALALLDELIHSGGHQARVEAADAKDVLRVALVDAGEVLLRHGKVLVRDVEEMARRWSG